MLRSVEVILMEVSLFAQAYESSIADVISFLGENEFEHIAALSGRARDNRLKQSDFIFVRRDSPLATDKAWD
jgi:hypothetical protein